MLLVGDEGATAANESPEKSGQGHKRKKKPPKKKPPTVHQGPKKKDTKKKEKEEKGEGNIFIFIWFLIFIF